MKLLLAIIAAADARLIRHNNNQFARRMRRTTYIKNLRHELDLLDTVRIPHIDIHHPIAV